MQILRAYLESKRRLARLLKVWRPEEVYIKFLFYFYFYLFYSYFSYVLIYCCDDQRAYKPDCVDLIVSNGSHQWLHIISWYSQIISWYSLWNSQMFTLLIVMLMHRANTVFIPAATLSECSYLTSFCCRNGWSYMSFSHISVHLTMRYLEITHQSSQRAYLPSKSAELPELWYVHVMAMSSWPYACRVGWPTELSLWILVLTYW